MKILHRYAISELAAPFGFFLILCTFVLLIQEVYRMFDLIFRYKVPVVVVGKLIVCFLPAMLALTLPMAILLCLLVAFGRLTTDNEIVAMKCCGVSLRPLTARLVALGALATGVMLVHNNTILPWANYQWRTTYYGIVRDRASVLIEKVPRVITDFEGYVFFVGRRDTERDLLGNVVVFDVAKTQGDETPPVIVAEHGRLSTDESTKRVTLKLTHGAMHRVARKDPTQYNRLDFDVADLDLDIHRPVPAGQREVEKGSREMGLREIYAVIQKEAAASRDTKGWWTEFWLKVSIPFACLSFVLVGVPLSLMFRRGGQVLGFVFGALLIFLYNGLLEAGDIFGERGYVNPHWAVWVPNVFFALLGGALLWMTHREVALVTEHTGPRVRALFSRVGSTLSRSPVLRALRAGALTVARALAAGRRATGTRILDLYVVRTFVTPFLLCMAFVFVILLSAEMLDRVRHLLDNKPTLGAVLEYFLWRVPLKMMEVVPVAVFLSTLIALGIFVARREVTAMKAAGITMYRVWAPVLAVAALISAGALAFNEYVVPYSSQRMNHVLRVKIWKNPEGFLQIRNHVSYFEPEDRRLFYARLFDGPAFTLHGVTLLEFDPEGRLSARTDAPLGRWIEGRWRLYHAVARRFEPASGDETSVTQHADLAIGLKKTPRELGSPQVKSETMGLRALWGHIQDLKAGGLPHLEYLVDFYYRLLLPAASFVLALLACGIPFLFHGGRATMGLVVALSFLATLLVTFVYYGLAMAGRSLGAHGVVPALPAVAFSHVFFVAVGFAILRRAPK